MAGAIKLDDETTWPDDVLSFLDRFTDELGDLARVAEFHALLARHAVVGWHLTRLTGAEVENIRRRGMQLADLDERSDLLERNGEIAPEMAAELRGRWASGDGRVWFTFESPRSEPPTVLAQFLGAWGGVRSGIDRDDDAELWQALRYASRPTIITANVPFRDLDRDGATRVSAGVLRNYALRRRGGSVRVPPAIGSVEALAPRCIRGVTRYRDAEFVEITACGSWPTELRASLRRGRKPHLTPIEIEA